MLQPPPPPQTCSPLDWNSEDEVQLDHVMHGSWKLQEEPADDLKVTQYSFTHLLMFCCVGGASRGLTHARQVVPAELHPSPPLGLLGLSSLMQTRI